jgi:drug/metabolite transporter (DMT)-like permease
MDSARFIGVTAALTSAAAWAVGAVLFKQFTERVSPLGLNLAKSLLGMLFLGTALAVVGFRIPEAKPLWLLAASGVLGIAVADTLFFAAIKNLAPQAMAALMPVGQVLTVLIAVLFLGESPSPVSWLGIALVITGVATIVRSQTGGEHRTSRLKGAVFGLLWAICQATASVLPKPALQTEDSMSAAFWRLAAGALGLVLFGLATRRLDRWLRPLYDRRLAARFAVSVFIVSFGGFWLAMEALDLLDASIANTLGAIEPLFMLPLAAVVFHERISAAAAGGTLISVVGVGLICAG